MAGLIFVYEFLCRLDRFWLNFSKSKSVDDLSTSIMVESIAKKIPRRWPRMVLMGGSEVDVLRDVIGGSGGEIINLIFEYCCCSCVVLD